MMKSGAPPDKFMSPVQYGFTSRINSKGYHSLVPGLISLFRDRSRVVVLDFIYYSDMYCYTYNKQNIVDVPSLFFWYGTF